jgi:hypothetical protein
VERVVLEVINEDLIIILKDVFQVLECYGGLYQETNGGLQLNRTIDGVDISPEADLVNSLAIVLVENSFCSDMLVDQEKSATDQFSTLDVNGSDVNILAFGDHKAAISRNFFVWAFVQSVVGLWVFT